MLSAFQPPKGGAFDSGQGAGKTDGLDAGLYAAVPFLRNEKELQESPDLRLAALHMPPSGRKPSALMEQELQEAPKSEGGAAAPAGGDCLPARSE